MLSDSASGPSFGRRTLLRAGLTAVVGTPIISASLTACGTGYATDPDPLLPLLTAARVDTAAANGLTNSGADSGAVQEFADVRGKHARVLRAEVDRLNRPLPAQHGKATSNVEKFEQLAPRLAITRKRAMSLAAEQEGYRAALVGSVAAGCAGLQQLTPEFEPDKDSEPSEVTIRAEETGELDTETLDALQTALAAEYAADWVYSLVTAYLPTAFEDSIERGSTTHRRIAGHTKKLLTAAGKDPEPPKPAYVPEEAVTGEDTAIRTVVAAETDTSRCWRGVLARASDRGLRTSAASALCEASARVTPWRAEADIDPVAVALPGKP